MLTQEQQDFLSFYGLEIIEQQWVSDERLRYGTKNLSGHKISTIYTIKMYGEEGLNRLLKRIEVAENTRRTITEKTR